MIPTIASMTSGGQVAQDTVVFVAARDGLGLTTDIAIIVIAVLAAVFLIVSLAAYVRVLRLTRTLHSVARDVRSQVAPTVARIQTVADNLTYVSATVREDMDRVHRSVSKLTGRLNQASDHVEERIEEFNALLEVVQAEAEDLFLDTASTVRAVQAGAKSLSASTAERPEPSPEED